MFITDTDSSSCKCLDEYRLFLRNRIKMTSAESDALLEDELQALHQSIEQLNASTLRHSRCSSEGEVLKNATKRKRTPTRTSRESLVDVQTQTPRKRSESGKRRKVSVPAELLEQENPIDEILEEIAHRKKLSTNNVKHLLRNIISHESVQQLLKHSLTDSSNVRMPFEPKLTRSKTKEWLESQNLCWPSSSKKTSSDTCILMEEEFLEDSSSDDEYRPNEDDHSDEESFLSSQTSDMGSPVSSVAPPTPNTAPADDPFKRPLPIEPPEEAADLIGRRTRSKLPLNDTPLEHLELAFVPPDISTDMYDSDCDNEEWRNFLKEYVCPTTYHSNEPGDDEEADPEYNVLEEEEEVDAEELRADRTVQITKKEVSELLSELFEEASSSDDETHTRPPPPPAPTSRPPSTTDILQTAMTDIMTPPDASMRTPIKPTGVVQPMAMPTPSPESVVLTVMFPTLDHTPITVYAQQPAYQPDASVSPEKSVVLSPEAKLLLEEQMRKHVQLLTQMHLITAQQVELAAVAQECRSMLNELVPLTRSVDIANLEEAVNLVAYWDQVAARVPSEDTKRFQRKTVTSGEKTKYHKRSSTHPERYPFDPQMVDLMAQSRIFIYPSMLPKLAVFQIERGPCTPSAHEEQLLAMGLEQFTPFCTELLGQDAKPCAIHNLVCSMISHYMLPNWSGKKISFRIKRLARPKSGDNAVKYYLEHKMAPPIYHTVQPFDRYNMARLCDMDPSTLPVRWRELVLEAEARFHRAGLNSTYRLRPMVSLTGDESSPGLHPLRKDMKTKRKKKKRAPPQEQGTTQSALQPDPTSRLEPAIDHTVAEVDNPLSASTLDPPGRETDDAGEVASPPPLASTPEPRGENVSDVLDLSEREAEPDETSESVDEEDTPIHTSGTSAELEETAEEESEEDVDINGSDDSESEVIEDASNDSAETVDVRATHSETPTEEFRRNRYANTRPGSSSSDHPVKRYVLIQRMDDNSAQAVHVWGPKLNNQNNHSVRRAADYDAGGQNSNRGETAPSSEQSQAPSSQLAGNAREAGRNAGGVAGGADGDGEGEKPPPSSPLTGHSADDYMAPAEDDEEEEDVMAPDATSGTPSSAAHSAPSKGRSPAHRQIRHQRNARRILDSWMADEDPNQPRSDSYAQVYFMKVRNRLEPQDPAAYKEFVTTLGHFQSTSGSTVDLYRKVETILSGHPDLMDEFVLFLSPEEAAMCGAQFQHFLYVRMRDFFTKLKIHFKDSPSQLKRTLKALQQVESSASPSANDIKNAVLPILKGNGHLTQVFLQLFPDDPPPLSDAGDFEDVNMEQVASGDEFEYVYLRESVKEGDSNKAGRRTGSGGSKSNVKQNRGKGKSLKNSHKSTCS